MKIFIIKCKLNGGHGPILNDCYYSTKKECEIAIAKFTEHGVCDDRVWTFDIVELKRKRGA